MPLVYMLDSSKISVTMDIPTNSELNRCLTSSFESPQYWNFFPHFCCCVSYATSIDFILCIYDHIVVCLHYVFVCYHTMSPKVRDYLNIIYSIQFFYIELRREYPCQVRVSTMSMLDTMFTNAFKLRHLLQVHFYKEENKTETDKQANHIEVGGGGM